MKAIEMRIGRIADRLIADLATEFAKVTARRA
jgi:hypothetical protein